MPITTWTTTPAPAALPGAVQAVAVFDLDGTLVDTAPDLAASVNHCLSEAGLPPVPEAAVRPRAGLGVKVMLTHAFADAGVTLTAGDLDRWTAAFLSYYEAHIADRSVVFPGAIEAMDRLEAQGFVLAICTNKTEQLARLLCQSLGIAARVRAICGADTFQRRKPDPIHLLGTIARAGGDARTAVMIGDSRVDIDAAWACGVPSILVDFGYGADAQTREAAGSIVSSYAQIDATLIDALVRERPHGS